MKKYILFDLDGTLTDPKEGITKSVQYALRHYSIEVKNLDDLIPFIGPPLDDSFMEFYGFSKEQADEAIEVYRERFSTIGLFENNVIDGIPEALQKLKDSGKIMAVATSKPTIFARQICDKYKLSQYFDCVIGSELDGTRCKKSEVIEEVLRAFDCTADEAIMVGDRRHDILGAKECGMMSVGVQFGYAEDGELKAAGADYIVDTPEELSILI